MRILVEPARASPLVAFHWDSLQRCQYSWKETRNRQCGSPFCSPLGYPGYRRTLCLCSAGRSRRSMIYISSRELTSCYWTLVPHSIGIWTYYTENIDPKERSNQSGRSLLTNSCRVLATSPQLIMYQMLTSFRMMWLASQARPPTHQP